MNCEHLKFRSIINVAALPDSQGRVADITIECAQCGQKYEPTAATLIRDQNPQVIFVPVRSAIHKATS